MPFTTANVDVAILLQSGDIAIFPREVKEPIVPLFDVWDKIMHNKRLCYVD